MEAWLDCPACGVVYGQTVANSHLVRRYLPPGSLHELYEHYSAVQAMVGASPASQLGVQFEGLFATVWESECCGRPLAAEVFNLCAGVQQWLEGCSEVQAEVDVSWCKFVNFTVTSDYHSILNSTSK